MARNNEAVNSYHLTSFVCKTASFCIHLPSVTSFVCTRPAFCTRVVVQAMIVCPDTQLSSFLRPTSWTRWTCLIWTFPCVLQKTGIDSSCTYSAGRHCERPILTRLKLLNWVTWTKSRILGQQSSARTALGPSRPQRLICSRRRSYIPATVPRVSSVVWSMENPGCRFWR